MEITFEKKLSVAKEFIKNKNATYLGYKEINKKICVFYYCNKHKEYGMIYNTLDTLFKNATTSRKNRNVCIFCSKNSVTLEELKENPEIKKDVDILSFTLIDDQTKIKVKCKHCENIWWISPLKLVQGRRCPICKNKKLGESKRLSNGTIQALLNKNNPNIEIIGEYKNLNSAIECRCKIHNYEWNGWASNILYGISGCPICNSSIGENLIGEILDKHNIKYIRQYKFDDCVYKCKLRFDFYLPDINTCIEYQGEQHYFPVNFKGGESKDYLDEFKNNQIRDNIKREYCKDNKITLIEIPYTEKNNISDILKQYNIYA